MNKNGKLIASFKLKNTGNVKGAEVVQLYIRDLQSSVDRPEKELKSFKKVNLNTGEENIVEFEIDEKALSFFRSQYKKNGLQNLVSLKF